MDENAENLATGLDALDEAEGDEKPGCGQATHVLPPEQLLFRALVGKGNTPPPPYLGYPKLPQ